MKIIIITTENEDMKETGFGKIKACLAVKEGNRKTSDTYHLT